MKIWKYLVFILAIIIAVYLILCLIGPKSMDVTRSITIKAPAITIHNMVSDLSKWEEWSAWSQKDTAMVNTYSNPSFGVGAWSSWVGSDGDEGKIEIVDSKLGKSMTTKLEFKGWDGYSNGIWHFNEKKKGNTEVSWEMKSSSDFPFMFRGTAFLMRMKTKLKEDFDEGLANIKVIAEKHAIGEYNGYKITSVDLPERYFVMNRKLVKWENIQQFYSTSLGNLFSKLQVHEIEMSGQPSSLYFKWDKKDKTTDMATAVPVKYIEDIEGTSSYILPAGKALQLDYYGPYNKSSKAHEALEDYIKDHGFYNNPPILEENITDASKESDPDRLLTKITYYVTK